MMDVQKMATRLRADIDWDKLVHRSGLLGLAAGYQIRSRPTNCVLGYVREECGHEHRGDQTEQDCVCFVVTGTKYHSPSDKQYQGYSSCIYEQHG